MSRTGFRLSRKTLFSLCLLIASFGVLLLFLNLKNQPQQAVHTSQNLLQRSEVVNRVRWKRPVYVKDATSFESSPYNSANKRKLTGTGSASSELKVISWQASRTLRVLSATSDMFQNCAVKACEVSPSAKSLPKARAVVFDDGRMNKQTPPQLSDKRVLVYYDMRTSGEVYFKAKGDLFSPYWKSAINWVWSYRLSSDIFEPFAYLQQTRSTGKLKQMVDDSVRKKSKLAVWINPKVNRKEDSLEDLDKNFHKGKSQTGVEEYMKDLKKTASYDTIDVITFQTEMNTSDTKGKLILSKYFFIFAFEWVDCQDYVSDLFFYAFDPRVMAVPVVRGGVNYTQHFPEGTYVNADNFDSPKELMRYLEKLVFNTKAYSQMLLKKSQYRREAGVNHAWCQLCDMVHRLPNETRLLERYEDIHVWTREHGKCVVANISDVDEQSSSEGETTKR